MCMGSLIARGHSIIYDERMEKKVNIYKDKELLHMLGPGIITGASDDDPSGIATYSGKRCIWNSITVDFNFCITAYDLNPRNVRVLD